MTSLDLCFTSDVIICDQNWYHLYSSSEEKKIFPVIPWSENQWVNHVTIFSKDDSFCYQFGNLSKASSKTPGISQDLDFSFFVQYGLLWLVIDLPQVDLMNFRVQYVRPSSTKDFSESLDSSLCLVGFQKDVFYVFQIFFPKIFFYQDKADFILIFYLISWTWNAHNTSLALYMHAPNFVSRKQYFKWNTFT